MQLMVLLFTIMMKVKEDFKFASDCTKSTKYVISF